MTPDPFHREPEAPLFALAHSDGPVTEKLAIERHERAGRAGTNRNIVRSFVRGFPGRTSAELDALITLHDVHEIRRRLTDLLNRGEVEQGDKRECAIAGTLAVTWRIVE